MMPKPSWLGLKNADAVIVSMFGRVQVQNAWSEMREERGLKSVYLVEGDATTSTRYPALLRTRTRSTERQKDWPGLGQTGTFVVVNVTPKIDPSPRCCSCSQQQQNGSASSGVRSNMLAGHWELETKRREHQLLMTLWLQVRLPMQVAFVKGESQGAEGAIKESRVLGG